MNFKSLAKHFIIMILSLGIFSTLSIPTFATIYYSPEATVATYKIVTPAVNGNKSNNISYCFDDNNPHKVTIYYNGDGNLIGWNLLDKIGQTYTFEELSDKIIVNEKKDNYITLAFVDATAFETPDGYQVNAIIEDTAEEEIIDIDNEHAEKDVSAKSPDTGKRTSLQVLTTMLAIPCVMLVGLSVFLSVYKKIKFQK